MARSTSPVSSTFQSLPHEGLVGEEEVLPVLHEDDRKAAERVLVVAGRQVAADLVVAVEELRRELHERREPPHLGVEEVRIGDPRVLLGHDHELVGSDRPVRGSALDQAGLEVQERLVRLEREGRDVAVLADRHRLEVAIPVLLGAQHHAAAARRVGDPEGPGEGSFGAVKSLGWRRHLMPPCASADEVSHRVTVPAASRQHRRETRRSPRRPRPVVCRGRRSRRWRSWW